MHADTHTHSCCLNQYCILSSLAIKVFVDVCTQILRRRMYANCKVAKTGSHVTTLMMPCDF